MTDHLEPGLTALDEFSWDLGGLRKTSLGESGLSGLDDLSEIAADEQASGGDGDVPGHQRVTARSVDLSFWLDGTSTPGDLDEVFAAELQDLRKVLSPLPDRTATRLLRWRLRGEVAKRLWVRPATGRPLTIPGNRQRLLYDSGEAKIRLTAPDPTIYSDVYHEVIFEAGETKTIVNAGSLTAVQPIAWWITSPGPVAIEHLDYPSEYIRFPTATTTTRALGIQGAGGTWGLATARNNSMLLQWPLLRPGENRIKASAACTFRWRDTW